MAKNTRGAVSRRAYARIRRDILAGTHAPGSLLSENELAADLGISRTPVRTALSRLQDEGWIRIYPQRGALVRELTEVEIREAAQARHALETAGVMRASQERLGELTDGLPDEIARQRSALTAGDFATFNELSGEFHRAFVALAGNATMLELYDRLQDRMMLATARSAADITESPDSALDEHAGLARAAADGDWVEFARLLDLH
ncbi:MAG TPA: GntR family transcriptional regulator [Flexivirga sp.]|uniref:GntR family transcriptional regulator n=1 Tax=Flexivirga sp. TaxID=1962927 RepID=UPI002BCC711E|nr:GntR family transcriptional regulator [Flexivirga sp.]HWC24162.1 GntR family transcriptional regulator [Flexivirga sp.]